MAEIGNSKLFTSDTGIPLRRDACIVMVRTEWNAAIVDELEKGCRQTLQEAGCRDLRLITVPGAFEIPFAVRAYWKSEKDKKKSPAAFITLACVMRGGTPHFDYVCRAVTDGVLQLNLELPVPVVYGVLTVDNLQQAEDRIGGAHGHKGKEAALTALKMIGWVRSLKK
jgi:6,7-dimethyl-8-ribityllumazine synthase